MSCWIGGRDEEADRMDAVLSFMVVMLLEVLSLSLSLADEAIDEDEYEQLLLEITHK